MGQLVQNIPAGINSIKVLIFSNQCSGTLIYNSNDFIVDNRCNCYHYYYWISERYLEDFNILKIWPELLPYREIR